MDIVAMVSITYFGTCCDNNLWLSFCYPHNSQVVHLYKRKWIEETTYPHFTMIGQSLGSMYLGWEALCKFTPLYYFDTSGYAFTYPLARLFGCKVICYTHYPTISSDMLSRVRQRSLMYNNDSLVAKRFDFQSFGFSYFFPSSNSIHMRVFDDGIHLFFPSIQIVAVFGFLGAK
jgi:hypothetical protein